MTCKCVDNNSCLVGTKIDLTCPVCSGIRFHTKYKRGERVAWVCDKCKELIPREIKKKRKKREVKKDGI
jgi:hypothetical protein